MSTASGRYLKSILSLLLFVSCVFALKVAFFYLPQASSAAQAPPAVEYDQKLFDIVKNGSLADLDAYLQEHGEVDAPTNDIGWTPLMLAAGRLDHEKVRYLLERGADVHRRSKFGDTALILVAAREKPSEAQARVAALLVLHGADVDARNDFYESPLFFAEFTKNEALLRALKKGP